MNVSIQEKDIDTPVDHNYHESSSEKTQRWESTRTSEYWDYRRKWIEYPKKRILSSFPIHLDIEATNACNLKCEMCPRTEMVKSGNMSKIEMFDYEIYKKLIDEGVQNGLCSIKYNFIGEPTLNPKLIDMIKYAKEAGVIDVMFNTNATLLDAGMARRLISSGLDKLFFSFDSPYREHYNKIRVGADYEKVLNNIKQFMKIREEMGLLTPFTRVSMVLMKDNESEWSDYNSLFEPIVDAVGYVDYLDQGGLESPERTVVPLGTRKRFCCPQLWQRMFVHPDGKVTVCCIDGLRTLEVGNIFEQSAKDIWLGDKYKKLRDLHASGRYDEIPICSKCALASY